MSKTHTKLSSKDKRIIRDFKLDVEEAYLDRFWRNMLINDVKKRYREAFPHLKNYFA